MFTVVRACRCVRAVRALCFAILGLQFAAPGGLAQTNTGEIAGIVKDASGAILPGATVTATHPDSGTVLERVTDGEGRFFLPALRIGRWELAATLTGFTTQRRALVLEVGRTVSLEFTLSVGGVSEQVTVAATAPLLQTTNAEISDIIENREVVQLPLNGRNFLALAQLSDAVVVPPGGTRGGALGQAGQLPNVGGQRAGHNIYMIDGSIVTDNLFNNLVVNPSVDSIQEFKIQKSMYPAEFGGKASALINVVTRSGANRLTGRAFEFHRNQAFDSRNYFQPKDQPLPKLRQNQFGGALGGRIVPNRTFFFGSYETTQAERSLTRVFSVPSAAVRGGDFAGLGTICDPLTIPTTGACQPFVNNRIPTGRIDPIAAAFLQAVPLPTRAGNVQNLAAVEPSTRDLHQASIRVDHRLGDADQLFARFSTFDAEDLQPYGTGALQESLVPGFGRDLTTHTRNLVVSHTHVFGRSLLNEIRFGWMRVTGGQVGLNEANDFASRVGLLGVTTDPRDMGYPQFSTGGLYSTMGDPTINTTRNNENFELYENVTMDRGRHRFKFGGMWYHLKLRPVQADNARGNFLYTGQFTGSAFADFLLGYPVQASSGIGRGDEDGRTNWFHLYAQDDWQARDNLTFNIGLRYEYNQHMYDVNNRLSSIDPETPGGRFVIASDENDTIHPSASALLPLIPIPYVTSNQAGWGRGLLDPSAVRLAPRLGFALSLNDAKTVVRGGYGIFLNQWAYSVQTAFARNLPFFFVKQIDVPTTQTVPTLTTRDILLNNATGTIGGNIMDYAFNVEYSQTWNGGVQWELLPATLFEIYYMGTWTLGADNATVRNVPEPGPGSIQARRPIPQLSRINAIRFDGKSIYHGLTFKTERRLVNDLAWNVSYTLSRSVDDASSPGPTEAETNFPQNVRNIFDETGEWALSSFNHTHQFIASGVYQLPFFRGRGGMREALLGGWRANAIFIAQTGAPFTVNLSVDRANVGAGPAQRPDQMSDPNLPGGQRTVDRWFDTSAFALPAQYTFGDAPRNSVTGPGYANVDVILAKTWRTAGSSEIEFRWEIFNLLNRANFDLPNRIFGNPNFGRISSAKNPREMQFGVRFAF
ncbi:MAG: carboxypeptidase regulatory-like domain-containing protein [Vicinamibacterales bacterium]